MLRFLTRWFVCAVIACTGHTSAVAQTVLRARVEAAAGVSTTIPCELRGVIQDDHGQPLAGAVVSALGTKTAFAISDGSGRFALRDLPAGPYLIRAHLQGYQAARGRVIQVTGGSRDTYTLSLARNGSVETPTILTAGVGGSTPPTDGSNGEDDHSELAWRLRHMKRSVLRDVDQAVADLRKTDSFRTRHADVANGFASLFADIPFNGQLDLLTATSFDRPQDLFLMDADTPRGIAYLSLAVPGADGEWLMRGTMTQGDVSSWIAAGSYRRSAGAVHAYEAGLSYSMQRYLGGNAEALRAMADGTRNVGAVYGYDNWTLTPRVQLGYGVRYARYDYVPDAGLVSPRFSITVKPRDGDEYLLLRATVARSETAPGADEFAPSSMGLWIPPVRTFSQISHSPFRPEQIDHVELQADRQSAHGIVVGVRTFRQRVDDQVVTLFGVGAPRAVADPHSAGAHYYVGSAGSFDAHGWGVSASRAVGDGIRLVVDYTQFSSHHNRQSADAPALTQFAPSVLRSQERIHDLTASVESVIAPSATRFFVLYKLNSGFAAAREMTPSAVRNVRFNVQVNQALPFLTFLNSNWEMLVAVSNLFRDAPLAGSVYDEVFVVNPPKRLVGGMTMRF